MVDPLVDPAVDVILGNVSLLQQRVWVIPVDDSDGSERALKWTLDNIRRAGDVLDLIHVIPASVDTLDGVKVFVKRRFIPWLEEAGSDYLVEVIQLDTSASTIGELVSKRAAVVNAAGIVSVRHNKSKVAEFFMGSVTKYLVNHSKVPVIIVK